MPRTVSQRIVFTLMMVFVMVFAMTVYTVAISQGGLTGQTFRIAIQEMWVEYVIVFCLIFFVITKLAMKLAARMVDPRENGRGLVTVSIQSCTVMCIVPIITLIATFLHNGFTSQWFVQWITTWVQCFPMAFFLQIFYAGPLVRFVFRHIFPEKAEVRETAEA